MNENNVTQTQEIIEKLDINFFPQVQNWLNQLYQIEEATFLSESFFEIPLGNILAAIFSLIFFLTLRKLFATLTMLCQRHSLNYGILHTCTLILSSLFL